jgi:hypothetical protein
VMLMNSETNYIECFVHLFFYFVYFCLIFVHTTYSLKLDVVTQWDQTDHEGIYFSSAGKLVCPHDNDTCF